MALTDVLSSVISDSASNFVKNIVSLFKVPADQAEAHAFELQKMQMDLAGKLQDALTSEIEAASANIRAEETSGDKYTARSRPTFLYLVEAILGWNFIVLSLLKHWGLGPLQLPQELYWLFGSGYLGYTGARTWEKFMGMPGESQMQLPFGIKMGNKN